MPEIPLGFSFAEADDGFILRRKSDDGTATEIKMSEAELAGLKAAIDLWSDRRMSELQVEPGSGVQAILVHPVARALLQSDAVQERCLPCNLRPRFKSTLLKLRKRTDRFESVMQHSHNIKLVNLPCRLIPG